jgi:hypothetical protein
MVDNYSMNNIKSLLNYINSIKSPLSFSEFSKFLNDNGFNKPDIDIEIHGKTAYIHEKHYIDDYTISIAYTKSLKDDTVKVHKFEIEKKSD